MTKADFSAWEHESIPDAEIERTAHLWLERHGAGAVAAARAGATEVRRKGDLAGADAWLRLIVAIEKRARGSGDEQAPARVNGSAPSSRRETACP
jgi:hypothetical protein